MKNSMFLLAFMMTLTFLQVNAQSSDSLICVKIEQLLVKAKNKTYKDMFSDQTVIILNQKFNINSVSFTEKFGTRIQHSDFWDIKWNNESGVRFKDVWNNPNLWKAEIYVNPSCSTGIYWENEYRPDDTTGFVYLYILKSDKEAFLKLFNQLKN